MPFRIAAEVVPPTLAIEAWRDEFVEDTGHRPGSPYICNVYLSRVGPSSMVLWERLARIASRGGVTQLDSVDLSLTIGLGEGMSRNAPFGRTLGRMIGFDLAYWGWGNTLGVRLALPLLAEEQVRRLPLSARAAHRHLAG